MMLIFASNFSGPRRFGDPWSGRAAWLVVSLLAFGCEPETDVDGSVADAMLPHPDASETLDAGATDSGVPNEDELDGEAAHDSGSELDAASRVDAAQGDAQMQLDAAATDAHSGHERSGEVVWNVHQADGSEFCPRQSIVLWGEEKITLHGSDAPGSSEPGFSCYLSCGTPAAGEKREVTYLLSTDKFGLFLMFREGVRLGYSTASFRENMLGAKLEWETISKTNIGSSEVRLTSFDSPPTVEIVSYEAPLLHVRVRGQSGWQTNTFNVEATAPYPCVVQSPFGLVPTVCTKVDCRYTTDDRRLDTHLILDLKLPIEGPAP